MMSTAPSFSDEAADSPDDLKAIISEGLEGRCPEREARSFPG